MLNGIVVKKVKACAPQRSQCQAVIATVVSACATPASAHVSEQGFVLLLPTEIYTAAGVAVVIATVMALALLPANIIHQVFTAKRWRTRHAKIPWSTATSLVVFAVLLALLYLGGFGPRDPLKNLLPLSIWTLWWIGLVALQGMLGDVWHWLNPWHGIARVLGLPGSDTSTPTQPSDPNAQVWPALLLFIGFYLFILADLAPDDPSRLAHSQRWCSTMVCAI